MSKPSAGQLLNPSLLWFAEDGAFLDTLHTVPQTTNGGPVGSVPYTLLGSAVFATAPSGTLPTWLTAANGIMGALPAVKGNDSTGAPLAFLLTGIDFSAGYTIMIAVGGGTVAPQYGTLFCNGSALPGWALDYDGNLGVANFNGGSPTFRGRTIAKGVEHGGWQIIAKTDSEEVWRNGTSPEAGSSIGNITNANPLNLFARGDGNFPGDWVIGGLWVWNSVLTAAQKRQVSTVLGNYISITCLQSASYDIRAALSWVGNSYFNGGNISSITGLYSEVVEIAMHQLGDRFDFWNNGYSGVQTNALVALAITGQPGSNEQIASLGTSTTAYVPIFEIINDLSNNNNPSGAYSRYTVLCADVSDSRGTPHLKRIAITVPPNGLTNNGEANLAIVNNLLLADFNVATSNSRIWRPGTGITYAEYLVDWHGVAIDTAGSAANWIATYETGDHPNAAGSAILATSIVNAMKIDNPNLFANGFITSPPTLSLAPTATGTDSTHIGVVLTVGLPTNATDYTVKRNDVSIATGQTGATYTDSAPYTAGQTLKYTVIPTNTLGSGPSVSKFFPGGGSGGGGGSNMGFSAVVEDYRPLPAAIDGTILLEDQDQRSMIGFLVTSDGNIIGTMLGSAGAARTVAVVAGQTIDGRWRTLDSTGTTAGLSIAIGSARRI